MAVPPSARSWLRHAAIALVLALGAAACSDTTGDDKAADAETADDVATPTTDAGEPAATDSDADPDPVGGPVEGEPGDLIDATDTDLFPGAQAWQVSYVSTGVRDEPVEVTGLVIAPAEPTAAMPLVTWAHGTTGTADVCAPSVSTEFLSAAAEPLVEAGYAVALTDYEGLGSAGPHPYLVGTSEGRSVLDIARAAQQLDLDLAGPVAIAGLSQGGHAALWAGEIAPDYAPDLDVVGVVAAAPATGISSLMEAIGTPVQGFSVMTAYAYDYAYDDVDLADYFNAATIERLADVAESSCTGEVFAAFLGSGFDDMVNPDGWENGEPQGALPERLAANEPGLADVAAPVLIVQGSADQIVPADLVESLHGRYCTMETNAEYRLYPGGGHGDTVISAMDEVTEWLDDRFGGEPARDGCEWVDPDVAARDDAATAAVEPAVEGTLLDGATPEGYATLVAETNTPLAETCPGTLAFDGAAPVGYSSSAWAVTQGLGPFLDVIVARFDTEATAESALAAYEAELIACGTFIDPTTGAEGQYSAGDDPQLADGSFRVDYTGNLSGVPVSRVSIAARSGDTIYISSQSQGFTDAQPDIAVEALDTMLP
ncbi:MAG: lipase family protein [Actinomycetota bacterium]